MYRAELVGQRAGLRLDREIGPAAGQPSPRFLLRDGEAVALDETLTATAARKVGVSPGARLLNCTRDLSLIVAAEQSDLVVLTADEIRLPVPGAEAACLFPTDHLLVAAQGELVMLLDSATGRIADQARLDVFGYLSLTPHPTTSMAVVTSGHGQDGSRVFAVTETGGRLTIGDLAEDVLAASFNPSGTRLLVTPHPTFASTLRVLSWPDGELVHATNASDLGLTGESFGVCGCYLDDGLVLAMTKSGRIVALDGQLELLGEVGIAPAGKGPDFMIGLSPANFAVQTWRDGPAGRGGAPPPPLAS